MNAGREEVRGVAMPEIMQAQGRGSRGPLLKVQPWNEGSTWQTHSVRQRFPDSWANSTHLVPSGYLRPSVSIPVLRPVDRCPRRDRRNRIVLTLWRGRPPRGRQGGPRPRQKQTQKK